MSFVLGLRHGVDADHIAAIDNTTRKLLQEGKRPITVGTWFLHRSFGGSGPHGPCIGFRCKGHLGHCY